MTQRFHVRSLDPTGGVPGQAAIIGPDGTVVEWEDVASGGAHTHPSTDVTDFTEAVQDAVGAMMASGANVTLNYDDTAGTLTVTASGGDAELMRDTIGTALVGINGVTVAVNDGADTITLSVAGLTIAQTTGLQAALDGKADDADLNRRRARARMSNFGGGPYFVPHATMTVLPLTLESYDTDNLHDNVTNNTRITLSKLGAWLVVGQVAFIGESAVGRRMALVYQNGVETARGAIFVTAASYAVPFAVGIVNVTATTDYVELVGYQDSTVQLTLDGALTYLSAVHLGG